MRWLPAAALGCIAAVIILALGRQALVGRKTRAHLERQFYVWQRDWSDPVPGAVRRAAGSADGFMVLVAEIGTKSGLPSARRFHADWQALSEAAVATTLCVRADTSLSRPLAEGRTREAASLLADLFRDCAAAARGQGVHVAGLQLDYDCPTSKLRAYRALLDALREELPGTELSITALPTWMQSPAFADLVGGLSCFVLQVHSFEKPGAIDEPIAICQTEKIERYVRSASAVGTAFYLSLPTYGYRVVFDERGRFAGLTAEGPSPVLRSGYRSRLVMSNPVELAAVVRSLRSARPPNCLGIVWFRLPVDTDELNWSWSALKAVMEGREPRVSFAAMERSPMTGLRDVWLTNTGERNVLAQVRLDLSLGDAAVQAYDLLGGFREEEAPGGEGTRLIGPAPAVGREVMIAWYRLAPGHEGDLGRIALSAVEVVK